uniref:Uncharacterized protein n=1 Tax=Octactis speculum TaxID=3111310 RepID=A0A7S2BK93_9STRA
MASKGLKYVRMILVSFLVSFHVSVESSPNRVGHNFRHSQLARRVAAGLPFFKINKDEDPRLIMFFNPEDEQCPVMTAMIEEIEEDFDQKILKLDVNKNVNAWLYQELQPSAGNGRLPFFYNRDTRFYIIATSNFHNMLTWATGGVCDVRTELPAEEDDIEAAMHETGFSARVNRVFEKVKSRGVKNFR